MKHNRWNVTIAGYYGLASPKYKQIGVQLRRIDVSFYNLCCVWVPEVHKWQVLAKPVLVLTNASYRESTEYGAAYNTSL